MGHSIDYCMEPGSAHFHINCCLTELPHHLKYCHFGICNIPEAFYENSAFALQDANNIACDWSFPGAVLFCLHFFVLFLVKNARFLKNLFFNFNGMLCSFPHKKSGNCFDLIMLSRMNHEIFFESPYLQLLPLSLLTCVWKAVFAPYHLIQWKR